MVVAIAVFLQIISHKPCCMVSKTLKASIQFALIELHLSDLCRKAVFCNPRTVDP